MPETGHKNKASKTGEHENKPRNESLFNAQASNEYSPYQTEQHITQSMEGYHRALQLVGDAEFRFYKGIGNPLNVSNKTENEH